MILVTGAGGKTGKAVIAALARAGVPPRALVHRAAHEAGVMAQGASEIVVGSFDDLAALSKAVRDIMAIYHICPNVSPREIDYARATIAAAAQAGVKCFVYHSVLHPQIEAMPHHWAKMRVEELLFESSLDAIVLQPTAYMQNILAGWREIIEHGVYRVPYPVETRLSFVDLDDVGAVAARVLTEPNHGGATYELVGTAPLSQIEVAQSLAEFLGKPVRAVAEPIQSWDARARMSRADEYRRDTLIKMFRYYAANGLIGNPTALAWLLGRPPTSLATFLRRATAGVV